MREKNGDFHEILTIFILLNDISFINHLIDVLYIYIYIVILILNRARLLIFL